MLSRLTLRWRLTLLCTAMFLVVGSVVVTMVYLQNRLIIMNIGWPEAGDGPLRPTGLPRYARSPDPPGTGIAIQRNEALGSLLVQWIVALTVMTALAGLLVWWVAGRVLRRVHRMTAAARRISTANLHERLAPQGPNDEIRELADTFDALLARLQHAFDAQARFVANASHELRTPLTVARTTLQVGLASTDPERVSRVREELLRNNDQCVRLINGLLTLARGEQDEHRADPVELTALVHEATDDLIAGWTAGSPAERPRVHLDMPARCVVRGDPVLLAQLVRNLLDNGLRYNVPDGAVRVRLDPGGRLTVGNTGPAIAADQVDRLFEPFCRGASRTGRTEGAGLGLSIVRAVAHSCGGTATARARTGGGLVVEVRLPVTEFVPADEARPPGLASARAS